MSIFRRIGRNTFHTLTTPQVWLGQTAQSTAFQNIYFAKDQYHDGHAMYSHRRICETLFTHQLHLNAQITFGILIPQWMRRSLLTPTLRKFPGWRLQLNFLHQSSRRNQEGNAEARNPYLTITLKDFRSILDTYTQSHFLNHSLACSLASSAAFASTSAPGLALTAKPCATPLYVLIW
jgi:hypothetical protein